MIVGAFLGRIGLVRKAPSIVRKEAYESTTSCGILPRILI